MTQECKSVSPDQPCPGSGGTRPAQSGSAPPRRYWYALTACVTLAIAIGAYLLQGEYREQADYWQEKLTRIGEVNEHLLKNWISERRDDGVLLAGFPCAQVGASRPPWRQTGPPPMWERQLRMELNSIGGSAAYSGAYILNHNGAVHARSDHAATFPAELAKAIVAQAEDKIITIPAPGGGAGYPQLAFVRPITGLKRSEPSEQPKSASGYAVLLTRPESIAKLLVTDAAATATGETLFVMLRLNHPAYVSPLRHWRKGDLPPPPPAGSPALHVLQNKRGTFGNFRDYRRIPVLADTRFISEPGWGMITKVDRDEAFADFYQTLILGASTTLLLILASVSLAAAWFRQQRIQRLQETWQPANEPRKGCVNQRSALGSHCKIRRWWFSTRTGSCAIPGFTTRSHRGRSRTI